MSRIFVVGGTGVLGRRVVPALTARGHDVTVNVRSDDAASAVDAAGASPTRVDVFDPSAVATGVDGHDVVVNVATAIPTGASAVRRSAWRTNDRIRTEVSAAFASAAASSRGRYIGESITFPYLPSGDEWIDESAQRTFFWGNESIRDAEAAAESVTRAGGTGVVLRFAMFWASDSAHMRTIASAARRGIFVIPGAADARISWIHVDDAASAVVAALDAPAGTYNVAEPDPLVRGEHCDALAAAVGRTTLRRVPSWLQKAAGAPLESMMRSQRISSAALTDATGWSATRAAVEHWSELAGGEGRTSS